MVLPPSGPYGLGGYTGQQHQGNLMGSWLGQMAQQAANYYPTPNHPEGTKAPPAVSIEQPERDMRDHLQRRVNKWLKGVELPLH